MQPLKIAIQHRNSIILRAYENYLSKRGFTIVYTTTELSRVKSGIAQNTCDLAFICVSDIDNDVTNLVEALISSPKACDVVINGLFEVETTIFFPLCNLINGIIYCDLNERSTLEDALTTAYMSRGNCNVIVPSVEAKRLRSKRDLFEFEYFDPRIQ